MKKKPTRRYGVTEVSGLTLKAYRPAPKKGVRKAKLPPVCYIYTLEELERFALQRGWKVVK